ncbi:recombination directionality factor [Kribbella sp. WER1]
MSLKIFGGENGEAPKKTKFSDDVVGRFRSGYQVEQGRKMTPVALQEWRVTTGDPAVAEAVREAMGGDEAQEWDATGEDNLEVFTTSKGVDVVLDGPKALRQRMILWGRNGKVIRESDGETCTDGTPDPQAGQSLAQRKEEARNGTGAEPQIEVYFRLAGNEDLGVFKFQSGSWSLASDLAYNGVADELDDLSADADDGKVHAHLSLEEVSFIAKNGPRAGQTVSYTKPVLKIKRAA